MMKVDYNSPVLQDRVSWGMQLTMEHYGLGSHYDISTYDGNPDTNFIIDIDIEWICENIYDDMVEERAFREMGMETPTQDDFISHVVTGVMSAFSIQHPDEIQDKLETQRRYRNLFIGWDFMTEDDVRKLEEIALSREKGS